MNSGAIKLWWRPQWVPYGEAKLIRYRWEGSGGQERSVRVRLRPGERFTNDVLDRRPLTSGEWHLTLSDGAVPLAEVRSAVR